MNSIWKEYHELQDQRRQKLVDMMREYDETIYRPAMQKLKDCCAAVGHVKGKFHDNGLGWTWWYCNNCGTPFDKRGPDA